MVNRGEPFAASTHPTEPCGGARARTIGSSACQSVPWHVVALNEATKKIYRRTDSATLVALLPELRRLNKAAQKERERLDRERADNDVDGSNAHDGIPHDTSVDEKFHADLGAYVAVAIEREMWIRNELKRRGLLPLWPGEEEHLDDDA